MTKAFNGQSIGCSSLGLGITVRINNRHTEKLGKEAAEKGDTWGIGLFKGPAYTGELRRPCACPELDLFSAKA